jgi:DNA-binding NarL/FixJ family response regulator
VLAALRAGAAGFIPKSSSNEVMLNAVRLVQAGGKYLPMEIFSASGVAGIARGAGKGKTSVDALALTAGQMDVLRLIASGAPNKVICRELDLAERTVKAPSAPFSARSKYRAGHKRLSLRPS